MPKNIVICCDGTGSEFGSDPTNVVTLHSVLDRRGQKVFYDPGVGTFAVRETLTRPGNSLHKGLGLALGVGFRQNVTEAYEFIVRFYEPGDRIYLFGFSRGAYTVRVVAALLRGVGVLPVGQENLIPYALRYLEMRGGVADWSRLRDFRRQFARPGDIGFVFLGLWDTVSSVSWFWDRLVYTATARNRIVDVVRHAVSIDELRAFFRTNLWRGTSPRQDVKQVWFAGVHGDVGGSYPEEQSGLSRLPLEWMLVEARNHGLEVDGERAAQLVARPELRASSVKCHRSLEHIWWLLELMPKRPFVGGRRRLRMNLAQRRLIAGRPTVHASVPELQWTTDYDPPNLPTPYDIEPWIDLDGRQRTTYTPPSGARVRAWRRWNRTSHRVEKGTWYRFEAKGHWIDSSRSHTPQGEPSYNFVMKLFSPLRRVRSANWFSVIGSIDRERSTLFDIGKLIADGDRWQAPASGTLFAFANDVSFMYWNNSGEVFLKMKMTRAGYLTKSRYTLARECPRKLYYQERPGVYQNNKLEDSFLVSLAEGGIQVGALARLEYSGGHEIHSWDGDRAVAETRHYLRNDNVILYEAAFQHDNLFVRIDIVVKKGNRVELYEVKAKSIDPGTRHPFFNKRALEKGERVVSTEWEPYLHDIAFQVHVCQQAHAELDFQPYLMLVDKTARASIDGLNQKIRVKEAGKGTAVIVSEGAEAGTDLLCRVSVSEHDQLIRTAAFAAEVERLAEAQTRGDKLEPCIGPHCRTCEFRARPGTPLRSGFSECWQEFGVGAEDTHQSFVFDVWSFRKARELIEKRVYLARDIQKDQIGVSRDGRPGLSPSERQWEQVRRLKSQDETAFVDLEGLRDEMARWVYPLHFVDFETAATAIPLNAGRRPYELIAFQFSHHVMREDGSIEHAGEFLHGLEGELPNFEFVRMLARQLMGDQGTVFRYANHENTVLCEIRKELAKSDEADRDELIAFIESITRSGTSAKEKWTGGRSMVDLLEIVKRYYYHPLTKGSNSIKRVLPAVLADSEVLQSKYSEPVYGAVNGIPSRNFKDWIWLPRGSTGLVLDPYKQLPSPFEGVSPEELEFSIFGGKELSEGGAAMTAYAKMQFSEMADGERQALRQALLRYCELDTFAMVMIVDHWRSLAGGSRA